MERIRIPNLCLLLIITTTLSNITAFSSPSSYITGGSGISSSRHDNNGMFILNLLARSDRDGNNNDSNKQGKVNVNNAVDDIWTNVDSVDKNNDAKKSQKLQIGTIIGSNNNTNNTSNTLEETSIDSTKWILIGGTVLILIAAGALSVTIGNDLGINLELG